MEIRYLSDNISHTKKMIDRLNYLGKTKTHKRIKQDIDYYMSDGNREVNRLNDLKAKLEILKNRLNTIE
ncbi:MAG: hypothetical protein Q4D67_06035, partial [Streptococcus minor]|nr:hypothetical protein [Streptococcus minor]